jgi:hypothetical protein
MAMLLNRELNSSKKNHSTKAPKTEAAPIAVNNAKRAPARSSTRSRNAASASVRGVAARTPTRAS